MSITQSVPRLCPSLVQRLRHQFDRFEIDDRSGIAKGIMMRVRIGEEGLVERIDGESRGAHTAQRVGTMLSLDDEDLDCLLVEVE